MADGKASVAEKKVVSSHGTKIIDKIKKAVEEKRHFYSFEYFPPKTAAGVNNLYARLDRMASLEPMFMDVTWGAGGSTADLTLEISANAQNLCSADVMMHLTCTNMSKEKIESALKKAKEAGIRNILALRGDPPKGADMWEQCDGGFAHAIDLVKYIKQTYGDYFGIAVAGYPEGHIESKDLEADVAHLKLKVEAGADLIITQLFYDVEIFLEWVKKCRAVGITVPILPGIMPIQNFNGFKRMTGFCKTKVPKEITDALEPIEHDDGRVKQYGITFGTKMCRQLLDNGVPGLHFYTLNLEKSVISILEGLGFVTVKKSGGLPWMQSQVSRRNAESVRPIFWANRPRSYLDRTTNWDEFPNGRWGSSESPAFGDLSDYHLCSFKTGGKEERLAIWGRALSKPMDVFDVFEKYIDGSVSRLPWCETSVQLETLPIKEHIKRMNRSGFLTINSQPRINGADSTDPAVGWGGPGGYVYQKAYLEFFTSESNLEKLDKASADSKSISFTAVNVKGQVKTNLKIAEQGINAVTWGVFPNREIMQPTVVDTNTFINVWKDEAFALWKSQWQSIYDPASPAYQLIGEIHDNYYLVNVVDNDFVKGDLFAFTEKMMAA